MAADELHVGDLGTSLRCTILDGSSAVNVSGANSLYLIFRKPNGTSVTKTASIVDSENGIIEYITESGFLDQTGLWRLQGQVSLGSYAWKSDVKSFKVYENL